MSNAIVNPFAQEVNVNNFDAIRIAIASPERIKSWSFGEVKKPETINYRTLKPERDGLFCARIFGPIKDYECLCGKYKRMKHKGMICEKCGVEVTLQKIRRERMGHIDLATPVAHIWFLKSLPSRISLMLDIPLKDLEKVLYFENYIVIDAGITNLMPNQLLSEEDLQTAMNEFGADAFRVGMGAEAIREIFSAMDLEDIQAKLREELSATTSDTKYKKIVKRLKLVESFLHAKIRPEWMILTVLPVLSPELRPLVPLDGGRFASSDLNDLYRRVINRNNRLKRLLELGAPDIIIRNEKRMLQESVDALFDNGRRGRPITGSNRRPLKSFSDMLKGKEGRFRKNLLGKRVDYSGRSVITVGPYLKLHECGLPKKMAIELFKPFIYSKLELYGYAPTIKAAKRMVEKERPEVWGILDEVIKEHPVLLNRAPTLHRLGIQAFEPKLIEGKAIHLHPLVCSAFNADFDGDQMAVHVPLSLEAQLEARVLMMSTNNILSPANGHPIIVPSQDIVLGLYYLSIEREGEKGEGKIFGTIGEVHHALHAGVVSMHTKIVYRHETIDADGNKVYTRVNTTPGRVIIAQVLPKNPNITFDVINKLITKKEITTIIDKIYRYCGQKDTVIFADNVMQIGFDAACKAGISFGKDDLVVPKNKTTLVNKTEQKVKEYESQFQEGLITRGEKYNKVIDAWSQCTESVAAEMMKEISQVKQGEPINSVYMMAHSGARGSATQMKQLAGMRGLMAKPSGEIIESPIISNFKEGLTALEYFNSTHGARKGLADTALKTANSGYLTRRLVDASQDCTIVSDNCGTRNGIYIQSVVEGGDVISSISDRILGRVIAEDAKDPMTGKVIIPAETLIDESLVPAIESAGIENIKVFSALTCEEQYGICSKCYGRDLARGKRISIGEAVGIIAAQSIGEPGTQLTMRTFHIGGAAQRNTEKNSIEAPIDGVLELRNCSVVENSDGIMVVMTRNGEMSIKDAKRQERFRQRLPYGSRVYAKTGDSVKANSKLAEWDPFTTPIISEADGVISFADIQGIMTEKVDESTGVATKVLSDWRQMSYAMTVSPRVLITTTDGKIITLAKGNDASYSMQPNTIVLVNEGQSVKAGDILARMPRETAKTRDITGGLPRVAELFESRKFKDAAILSDIAGIVEYAKDYKAKRRIVVRSVDDKEVMVEYSLPKEKQVLVYEGDFVEKGTQLTEGDVLPHDILRIKGVEALSEYMISEVQAVYRLQGVGINDKHIEVIVRQMLQKVEVTASGDTSYLVGKEVDRREMTRVNDAAIAAGKKPAQHSPILQGITKAGLQTDSFISAASFQETTRILTDASTSGRVDTLVGLKENVIVGRLIPAGTGRMMSRYRMDAEKRTLLEKSKEKIDTGAEKQ